MTMASEQTINEAELRKIRFRSQLLAVIIPLGFVLIAAFIGNNLKELNELEVLIGKREGKLKDLQTNIEQLESDIYNLRYSPTDEIIVKAGSVALPGITELDNHGRAKQVYQYTVWIDLSSYRLKKLTQVNYKPAASIAGFESRITNQAANGFSMSYRGIHCLSNLQLDIEFEDGSSQSILFDACDALGQSPQAS